MDGSQEVAADSKEILHGAVHREKPLRVCRAVSRYAPNDLNG